MYPYGSSRLKGTRPFLNQSEKIERLRSLIKRPGLILCPGCFNPMSARVAELAGFESVILSNFSIAGDLAKGEPLVAIDDTIESAKRVTGAVNIPVLLEAEAMPDPLNVLLVVRKLEGIGAAGLIFSDQTVPKRAHHRDGESENISAEEMEQKIKTAKKVSNKNVIIVGLTHVLRTEGLEAAADRMNRYAEAGADLVCTYFLMRDEARRLAQLVKAPLMTINSETRAGEPLTAQEAEDMGYKVLVDSGTPLVSTFASLKSVYEQFGKTGRMQFLNDKTRLLSIRKEFDELTELEDLLDLEDQAKKPS